MCPVFSPYAATSIWNCVRGLLCTSPAPGTTIAAAGSSPPSQSQTPVATYVVSIGLRVIRPTCFAISSRAIRGSPSHGTFKLPRRCSIKRIAHLHSDGMRVKRLETLADGGELSLESGNFCRDCRRIPVAESAELVRNTVLQFRGLATQHAALFPAVPRGAGARDPVSEPTNHSNKPCHPSAHAWSNRNANPHACSIGRKQS